MKKHMRFILTLLSLCIFCFFAYQRKQIITTPYQYPIVPGTTEWAQLESRLDMLEICQIPTNILSKLSTDALLQTIIDYPFLSEMVMFYRTPEECENEVGFWLITDSFNGLQEFMKRDDAQLALKKYRTFTDIQSNNDALTIIYRNISNN